MEHKKVVNNGLWKEYHVTLLDPQQELQVRLAGLRAGQPGHTLLQLVLVAKVRGQARLEDWKDGLKLFTLTSDADCRLEADLQFDVAWYWKPGSVLGDLVVEPKVTTLDIKLLEFQLNKVSKIEGWTARQLGDAIEGTVSHELHQQQPKLIAKINAAIDKKKDKLHFSPDQALTTGLGKLETLLRPTDAQSRTEFIPFPPAERNEFRSTLRPSRARCGRSVLPAGLAARRIAAWRSPAPTFSFVAAQTRCLRRRRVVLSRRRSSRPATAARRRAARSRRPVRQVPATRLR